jgi:signal peptidase I
VVFLTLVTIVALVLRAFLVEPFSVPSPSMVPTLQVGDRILVVKSRLISGPIKTGDIVVLHQPKGASCNAGGGPREDLVTRVIGLPGEAIWSERQSIYVDGRVLAEPGWYDRSFGQVGPAPIARTQIPPGSYFVMGDNRTDECDSRSFGPVSGSLVVGKVMATILRHGHPHLRSL